MSWADMARLFALWLFWVGPACAATIEVIPPADARSPALIMVHGTLRLEDIEDFNFKLASVSNAVVVLESDGGSLVAGIRIGTLIRLRNVSTLVPDQGRCASACAIAWLGGANRYMGTSAQIGFHAAYRDEGGLPIETGAGNAILGAYLSQIGLTEAAIVYITSAAPSSMTWLTMAEAARHNIDVQLFSPPKVALTVPPPSAAPGTGPIVKPINPWTTAARVAIMPVVGPPDPQAAELYQAFSIALDRQRIDVVAQSSANLHLIPYVLAEREQARAKVSYVLEVRDRTGNRLNRFAGVELVQNAVGDDPWAAISSGLARSIAAKATRDLVAWLRPQSLPATVTERGVPVMVTVRGAPGDGNTSLHAALVRSLQTKDIAPTYKQSSNTYRVEGVVTLAPALHGKQHIEIEWVIKDPRGKRLGTVTQRNDIPAGALDWSWGRVAEQTAEAAVQGVLKLLPQRSD